MLERIDPADLARCVAAVAVMAYGVAEMPEALMGRRTEGSRSSSAYGKSGTSPLAPEQP